jgi:hypothetical protein
MTGLVGRVKDFIVEDREVKSKSEANWMGWCEVRLCDFGGGFVSLERCIGRKLASLSNGELGQITMVVSLPTNCQGRSNKGWFRYEGGVGRRKDMANYQTHIL